MKTALQWIVVLLLVVSVGLNIHLAAEAAYWKNQALEIQNEYSKHVAQTREWVESLLRKK